MLFLHFGFISVYANPFSTQKGKLGFLAQAYVYPWFQQNWGLFAPAPQCNYQLLVTYEQNGPQCRDIFNEIVTEHRANRLKGYEPLLIAFSNSIHFFEKNTVQQQALNGPVKNDLYFDMLQRAATNYLKQTRGKDIQLRRLMLVVDDVATGQRRVYFS